MSVTGKGALDMIGRASRRGERGLVMLSLLSMILVLTVLAALVLFLSGKETALSGVRAAGNESLYVAEGGSYAGRAALMAYMNAYPVGSTSIDPSLSTTTAAGWYAGGAGASQNPLGVLDYLVTDGQRFTLGTTPSTTSETFQVNWASGYPHLKLQTSGTPVNTLGPGTYTATVTLWPNPTADASCSGGGTCSVHLTAANAYEIFYRYLVTSDGQISPRFKREVRLSGTFSIQLTLQSFSLYALFTDVHTTPSGSAIWFTSNTSFNGPVHTNGEFRFAFFPTFTNKVESVSTKAWYNNTGNPLELATTENVQNGTRIDAPLVPPDPNPQSATPANFTLGASSVPLPSSPFNQEGVAIGRNPTDASAVTTAQITAAIPELTGSGSVPNGVYVPVTDVNGNCRSDSGDPMKGGVFVQGDVSSLQMSVSGSTAVYTLVQQPGSKTTTVTVDRGNKQTTVSSNAWLTPPSGGSCPGAGPGPATRTFPGVPKGWQGPGDPNATMIYVNGNVNAVSGTLQQNEQTTVAASGSITISGNIQYQTPPNPADPTSNPINVLGLYASGGDIIIGPSAPNNVIIQAVLMAGNSTSGYNSSVTVQNYNSGSPRGSVNLLGGLIEKYYGPFGTFNAATGQIQTGYGRAFTYDTRMSRGFTPPYFPTTNLYVVGSGSQHLEGTKPAWREATPP